MSNESIATVEEVIRAWDAAWSREDLEGVVALFAQTATLESPLVPRVLAGREPVVRGRDEIREVVRTIMQRGVPWGRHEALLIRGDTVAIEFRTADGTRFYGVDIVEVRDGRIQCLRAYAGWSALAGGAR